MLRAKLDLEPATDLGLYLGCQLVRGTSKLKDGAQVSTFTYDMESFLENRRPKISGSCREGRGPKESSHSISPRQRKARIIQLELLAEKGHSVNVVWDNTSHHGTEEIQVSFYQHGTKAG